MENEKGGAFGSEGGTRAAGGGSPATASRPGRAMPAAFEPREPRYALEDAVLPERTLKAVLDALAARELEDLVFGTWGLGAGRAHTRRVGINLYGPPGTGKTMVAHGIAARLGKRILVVDYADIESKYVGDTPKNLSVAFGVATEEDCVIFFDEADAILSRRLTSMQNATDTSVNQTRSVLLTLLNDFEGVAIFATNFIENYDPAFMRRMLAQVRFELPDLACVERLLSGMMPPAMPTDASPAGLARAAVGLSGGELANAVLLAALRGARDEPPFVRREYFLEAFASIRAGLEANRGRPAPPALRS